MTTAFVLIFWLAALLLGYAYAGYPLIVLVAARLHKPEPAPEEPPEVPFVSLIIAVQNEAELLAAKLHNTVALDYPRDRLEVIVAADGPSESVLDVLSEWAVRGVASTVTAARTGKTAAQNLAASRATGTVFVFSDVAAKYNSSAIRELVRPLTDPDVGCVTGMIAYKEPGSLAYTAVYQGARLRLRSELALRGAQSRAGVLFGATGCIYAIRADLFVPLREDLVSDLALPLKLLERGYRTVYAPGARALISRTTDARREFRRRSRIVLQGMRVLGEARSLANPFDHGLLISLTFWHRLLRWLAPLFLIALLLTSFCLASHPLYLALALAQLSMMLVASIGILLVGTRYSNRWFSLPAYFYCVNFAAFVGVLGLLAGRHGVTWEPTGGESMSSAFSAHGDVAQGGDPR